MKFAFVLIFGSWQFGAPPERLREEDRWFGADKAKHFVASAVIQGGAHALGRAAGMEYRQASYTAGMVTLTAGVTKELLDRHRAGEFSWRDIVADAAGGVTGAVVVRQLDR